MTRTPPPPLKLATFKDLDFVRDCLVAAIDEAIGDSEAFASFEKARFNLPYLHALSQADPGYVLVVCTPAGERAGFIVSSPEQGNLVLNWSYLLPSFRKGSLAMRAIRQYAQYWDHWCFHKLIFFARADKASSVALGTSAGFQQIAKLEKQFFGQDFLLFEKPLEKVTDGYAVAPAVGFIGRTKWKLSRFLRS